MLDLVTCAILSIITIVSLIIVAIGSSYRLKKLSLVRQKDLKIVLPKTSLEKHQPIWAHRAFQNKVKSNPALEYVDMITGRKMENPDPICITIMDLPKVTPI